MVLAPPQEVRLLRTLSEAGSLLGWQGLAPALAALMVAVCCLSLGLRVQSGRTCEQEGRD